MDSWMHRLCLQASIAKYKFRQNCSESKFREVLQAWNDWKPWQLSRQHALVDIECGYGHLWVQVGHEAGLSGARAARAFMVPWIEGPAVKGRPAPEPAAATIVSLCSPWVFLGADEQLV